jgi:hypothetical protein
MTDLELLVDRLLYEEEGTALDFKRQQYPFVGASAESKGELLKDALAFANSWRRTDAYILIGVREIRAGRSEVLGVSEHLDDASLQQFVNSKTQRPVTFSYRAVRYESKELGLIHIPRQERPVYLTQDFGGLEKNVVYVRRGSSTDQARPDEIARMGQNDLAVLQAIPTLTLALASSQYRVPEDPSASFTVRQLTMPRAEQLPDYRTGDRALLYIERVNRDYYRELAQYVRALEQTMGFYLVLQNKGNVVANDARVECDADRTTGILLRDSSDLPRHPRSFESMAELLSDRTIESVRRDLWVKRRGDRFQVFADFGKIQAGAEAWSADRLFVGAQQTGDYTVIARVYPSVANS